MAKTTCEPVREERLAHLISEAVTLLQSIDTKRPVVAYSGGKDSIAVALLLDMAGLSWPMVCEISFYFAPSTAEIKQLATVKGWNVTYRDSLDWDFVRRNPHIVFADDSKTRGWTFFKRQQTTVIKHAQEFSFDTQVFGRRTAENSVKSRLYTTKAGLQCHPLRDWSTSEVWALLNQCGISAPWIYGTQFGHLEGNAPFYTLRAKDVGGVGPAWTLCTSLDPTIHPGRI